MSFWGFRLGAIPLHKAAHGPGYGPVHLDDLDCNGNEPHISQCGHNGVSDSNCQHIEDAGVICKRMLMIFTLYEVNSKKHISPNIYAHACSQ